MIENWPSPILTGDWKVPSPFPSKMNTLEKPITARSNLPSPSKSPATMSKFSLFATVKCRAGSNVPSPLLRSTDTLLTELKLAVARSGLPSPLKSPTTTTVGENTANSDATGKVPSPLPSSTETLSPTLLTTISATASPFTSVTTSQRGLSATRKLAAGPNVPSPWPRSTFTVSVLKSDTTTSGTPSPLRSPRATPLACWVTLNNCGGWKVPSPLPRRMDTPDRTATAKSGTPSPLRSPTAIELENGFAPMSKFLGGPKLPSPWPRKTVATKEPPKLATARSSLPSPLKSPKATPYTAGFTSNVCAGPNVPSPPPNRTETLPRFTSSLAVTTSRLPSPLKSPTANWIGRLPRSKLRGSLKVPSPWPSRIEMLLVPKLATTWSSMPSPLKSPATTATGLSPTPNCRGGPKLPSPRPRRMETAKFPGATARSGIPSPLKSPTAIPRGVPPIP